jgi:CRP-like cAMP-binding protein
MKLFGYLIAEELADIAPRDATIHFKKGEMLFLSEEQVTWLFVVVSGQIRVFQQNAEGRRQVFC